MIEKRRSEKKNTKTMELLEQWKRTQEGETEEAGRCPIGVDFCENHDSVFWYIVFWRKTMYQKVIRQKCGRKNDSFYECKKNIVQLQEKLHVPSPLLTRVTRGLDPGQPWCPVIHGSALE